MVPGQISPDTHTAEEVARLLDLAPLEQEGGHFRRSHEADLLIPGGARRAYSAIYMLITPEGFSALHKLDADEIWCFHCGDPLESLRLPPGGTGGVVKLGLDLSAGETAQDLVAAGVWQGTRLRPGGRWALVSCIVVPEFRWSGFTLADWRELSVRYPLYSREIMALCR
jgi:hypothetical protein